LFSVVSVPAAGAWSLEPLQTFPLLLAPVLYARRASTLAMRGRPVPGLRQISFYFGVAIMLAAFISPIDTIGERNLFYVHMVQHLMLGDLGPLFIVLGLNRALLRPVLALPLVRHLRVLAHPLVAFPLWTLNLYLWHVPALYQSALHHSGVHALEHTGFFLSGAMMWAAAIEPLPGPAWFGTGWKSVYMLGVRVAGAVLANVFIWSDHVFYPAYAGGERDWGISPLSDQTIGGAIMFTEGGIVTLIAFALLFMRWQQESERRQQLLDRGVDPAVAARAARYSRSPLARGR
jgi:cytochrome c oxidase assembly factor CtaG